jgi:hypothetical protein
VQRSLAPFNQSRDGGNLVVIGDVEGVDLDLVIGNVRGTGGVFKMAAAVEVAHGGQHAPAAASEGDGGKQAEAAGCAGDEGGAGGQ